MQQILNENDLNIVFGFVAVKFGAIWCSPCKKLEPIMDKLEKEFSNVKFVSVDIDDIPNLAKQYQIRSLPTIILFKNGREMKKIQGLPLTDSLRKTIREFSSETVRNTVREELFAINV